MGKGRGAVRLLLWMFVNPESHTSRISEPLLIRNEARQCILIAAGERALFLEFKGP